MKKNGQYVGVNDEYVPEDEKYVDEPLNSEIKDSINDGIKHVKDYVSDKDNQEKIKQTGSKGLKIAKGIGIGYLIYIGLGFLFTLVIIILIFTTFFKLSNEATNSINRTKDNINDTSIKSNDTTNNIYDEYDKMTFNSNLERYNGTQNGSSIRNLLENVVTLVKKNSSQSITILYGTTITSNVDEIVNLKKQFIENEKYEVLLDYDRNGFVNKITISNY